MKHLGARLIAAIRQAAAPSLVDPAQPTVKRRDIAVLNRPIGDTSSRLAQGNRDLVGYALFLQNPVPDLCMLPNQRLPSRVMSAQRQSLRITCCKGIERLYPEEAISQRD